MALTDEQLEILGDKYLVNLYQQLEKDVLQDIARRVRKTGRLTETAELQAKSMREQGYSTAQIYSEVMRILQADPKYQKMVQENTKAYKAEVQSAIDETVAMMKEQFPDLSEEAANMSYNNDLEMWNRAGVPLSEPNSMSQIVRALNRDVTGQLENLTKTTGFKGTVVGTTGVEQAYTKAVDISLIKVATGTFSFDEACNAAVKDLAKSGLRSVDYASGRTYQMDTAVRMSVRTGINKLAGKITEANCESTGQDLVIVSQHEGARPSHQDVENQIFSLSGNSRDYPAFSDPLPVEGGAGAAYGDAGGIGGINCRHSFYPWFEGVSEKPAKIETWDEKEVDGKTYDYYDATQKQRSMEREIRALKRESYCSDDDDEIAVINKKIRQKTAKYHDFSEAVGIRAKDNRLKVVGS